MTSCDCRPRRSRWGSQVRRNGYYRPRLPVEEGSIEIRVLQVECKGCGRSIAIAGRLLKRRRRYWIELDQTVTELYMSGFSQRKVVEILAGCIESGIFP